MKNLKYIILLAFAFSAYSCKKDFIQGNPQGHFTTRS
jgi:hypothetical protein